MAEDLEKREGQVMGMGKGGKQENADLCERREEQAVEGRKDDRLLEAQKIMGRERKDWLV